MFGFDALLDKAKDLIGGAEGVDPAQLLSDAGLDLGALAEMAPEEAATLLSEAGLDPELLASPEIADLIGSVFDTSSE